MEIKELHLSSPGKENDIEIEKEPEQETKIEIIPFKKVLLKIYKGENKYYLLDRTKYDINTIMMLLDLNKINKLAEFFKGYPDGIEKVLFIAKMKKELPNNLNDPMDESNLVYGLYKFFCEIDFNGDGHMQWEEFTQFIIDTVEGDNEAKISGNEDDTNNKIFNEKEMIKFKRYHLSRKLKDNLVHKKDIICAVFLSRVNMIVMNEYGTKNIKIYNPKNGRSDKIIDLDVYLKKEQYTETIKNYKKVKNSKKKTITEQEKQSVMNTTYSVLYLCKYQNIVAMCLSDKRIVFFHFPSEDRIELIYEMSTPVLEKRIWFLPEHGIWVSSGSQMEKYSYYTLNELDIEFISNNQKYECLYNEGHPFRKSYCEKIPHKGEIMDCIEIIKPKMVITACMDGKIRLINIYDRDIVKVWSNHCLGVRALDYNPLIDNIGYVLSVGFEYYINVYCTDLSIDEAFKGRLEGHYAPVISCKFLSYSYMAVSVDEEGNVRIWDTKLKICLQLIPTPKKNLKISNLLNLPKYNKFLIFGNKIIYYDAHYKQETSIQNNTIKDDNFPIKVEYNKYYQQFFITTFKDVRVYNKDGQLYKCYKKLITNEHFEPDVTIRSFIFENNYRKFYLGFSNGAIMQFNAGNGSLIKPVNEDEEDKDGIQTYIYSHTKEITSLFYYYDEKEENSHNLLLSTAYDSLINVYNEENPEETEKLRTIRGGHTLRGKVLEINCMDFSILLNLFATGGADGLVVCWDFEMSKIDDIFYLVNFQSDKLSVNYVKFLEPYPILAVSYNDGTLYFWGVKQNKERGECIFRARNYYKLFKKIDLSSIKYINIISGNLPEINYNVPLRKYFDENSPFMKNQKVSPKSSNRRGFFYNRNKDKLKDNNEEKDNKEEEENELDIVPDIYKNEIIDYSIDPKIYEAVNVENSGNDNKKSRRNRIYLIIGDSQGNIKLIDLMGYIKKKQMEPASKVIIKSTFNILKKDDINAETILNHNITPVEENSLPRFTNMYHMMIRNEFQAHLDEITCITVVPTLSCFITCSKDKFVKIFNYDCECLGVINALPKLAKYEGEMPEWKFNIDEKKILENEINEVVGIFEKVGVEMILVGSKTDKEVDNIQINEKAEVATDRIRDDYIEKSKRRFKKIEKVEKKKKSYEENKVVLTYEGFYVQEAERKIESIINVDVPQQGINEITSKVIGNILENDEKIKKEKNKILTEEIMEEKNRDKIRTTSFRNSLQVNATTSNKNVKKSISHNIKIPKLNLTNINNNIEDKHHLTVETELKKNKYIVDNNQVISEIKITPKENNFQNSRNISFAKKNKSNLEVSINLFNKNKKNAQIKNKIKLRNGLFSERLFTNNYKEKEEKEKGKLTDRLKFSKKIKSMKLPFIGDKIIFNKGETEKLLNYQFYNTSYRACCQIFQYNNVPNSSMKANYKNNWNIVTNYVNEKRDDEYRNKNKKNFRNKTEYK